MSTFMSPESRVLVVLAIIISGLAGLGGVGVGVAVGVGFGAGDGDGAGAGDAAGAGCGDGAVGWAQPRKRLKKMAAVAARRPNFSNCFFKFYTPYD